MVLATVTGECMISARTCRYHWTNNGYKVINLGIKQSIDTILNAYEEHQADAIGMSAAGKVHAIMKDNLEVMTNEALVCRSCWAGRADAPVCRKCFEVHL